MHLRVVSSSQPVLPFAEDACIMTRGRRVTIGALASETSEISGPKFPKKFHRSSFFPSGACASKPCKNGGECVDDGKGGYHCKCTPNWEGKDCELPKCKFTDYFSVH